MKRILLALLRIYKIALSPYLGSQCRFLPTCSDYARDAVIHHGAARGSWMAACRLCRCHPFAQGGYDPVPGTEADDTARPDTGPHGSHPPAGRSVHAAAGHAPVAIRLPRP
ncbi:membrane protein insertion efficiency factor YidD [Cupriavidus sp. UYPR2.512]|uniref:membrane protein insertion efficiency factor YidD n=1 Tax=Cupriavidus sp. UYPR2.512 TaxID=1080187 RepID=UPI00035FFC2D|nr:membrane protein insertion efficiency factor YidD [Cupriavidus sp. UYPR2.512]UIF86253.1 membrane protein insertion efficiency factor YidD [Cupriavidus necator]